MKLIHVGAKESNSRVNVTITRSEWEKLFGITGRQVTYLFKPFVIKELPDKIAKYLIKHYNIIEYKREVKNEGAKKIADKYKINELRKIAADNNINFKGTKADLAERVYNECSILQD